MAGTQLSEVQIFRRVKKWQEAGYVHPLTCKNDSSHPILVPAWGNGKVHLFCPKCGAVQRKIPKAVLKGVPPLPAAIRRAIRQKEGVTVIISKKDWQALLKNGGRAGLIQVFSKRELHRKFGDKPKEHIVRVRITPAS